MKKILSPAYSLKLKNIILFLNRGLIFFSNGHIRNVVSTLPNVVKIDVENDNVVSTLSNVVQFNVEIHNVVSTLLNVVDFNIDVSNVVSTLIWRCVTSRRHINLKSTLNWRWNVCWGAIKTIINKLKFILWRMVSICYSIRAVCTKYSNKKYSSLRYNQKFRFIKSSPINFI